MSPADLIAALSGAGVTLLIGLATFLLHRRNEAREEAMELATVRGEHIQDLKRRIDELEEKVADMKAELDAARDGALQTQRAFARALRDLLRSIERELDERPPDVAGAKLLIRETIETAA